MQGPHRNSSGANSEALLLLGSDTDCKAILFEALSDNTLNNINQGLAYRLIILGLHQASMSKYTDLYSHFLYLAGIRSI